MTNTEGCGKIISGQENGKQKIWADRWAAGTDKKHDSAFQDGATAKRWSSDVECHVLADQKRSRMGRSSRVI